jgi:HSP20 family protein
MRTLVKTQCGAPANNRFFFDDFFGKEFFKTDFVKSNPAVNVKEDESQYSLELAAPGLQKEDFKVELQEGVLAVSAERKTETTEGDSKSNYTRKEFSYHSFKRSFSLDTETIDAESIAARYENGVLHVSIPKKAKVEEEKKSKTISIS